jgi:RimJ/RimL family protein N-acetyltransferase
MTNQTQLNIPTIATTRLLLRAWTLEDAPALFQILQEKDILRYFPSQAAPALEKVQRYINHHLTHWQTHGCGHWAVVGQETGAVLGWVGLEYLDDVKETEVAYLLTDRARGKGLATEAAQASIRFGLEQLRLQKILGLVHSENIASARVLQKCGMSLRQQVALWGMDLDWYEVRSKQQ